MAEEGCERNNGGKANTRREEERLFAKSWDVSTLVFFALMDFQLRSRISIRSCVRPCVGPSVGPSRVILEQRKTSFLDATTHLYKRSCPSIRRSVGPSVGPPVLRYFRATNMAVFEGKKSSNGIINNGTMSDDEIVASDVPPRYLFHLPEKCLH